MARSRTKSISSKSSPESSSIMSGLFGHFVTGSTVSCKSSDNTFFCNFTKAFNILLMTVITLVILYVIIKFAYGFMKK